MNAEALLALQQIDTALDQNRNRRTRLPEVAVRDAATSAVRTLVTTITQANGRSGQAQAIVDATERAAHELDLKRVRLEAQMKTVIAPREAEALMHEITTLGERRDELDEREFEALGEQEEADAEAVGAGGELPGAEAELAGAQAALDASIAELDAQRTELVSGRQAAAAMLSVDEIAAYEHARKQFDGVAVARLDGTRCTGCHLDIARGDLDQLRALPAGEPAECPQCGRFLVR